MLKGPRGRSVTMPTHPDRCHFWNAAKILLRVAVCGLFFNAAFAGVPTNEPKRTVATHKNQHGHLISSGVFPRGQITDTNPNRATLLLGVSGIHNKDPEQPWVASELHIGFKKAARSVEEKLEILGQFVTAALQWASEMRRPLLVDVTNFTDVDPELAAALVWNVFWKWFEERVPRPLEASSEPSVEFTSESNQIINHLRRRQIAKSERPSTIVLKPLSDVLSKFYKASERSGTFGNLEYTIYESERQAVALAIQRLEDSAVLELRGHLLQWTFQLRTGRWPSNTTPMGRLSEWLRQHPGCDISLKPG